MDLRNFGPTRKMWSQKYFSTKRATYVIRLSDTSLTEHIVYNQMKQFIYSTMLFETTTLCPKYYIKSLSLANLLFIHFCPKGLTKSFRCHNEQRKNTYRNKAVPCELYLKFFIKKFRLFGATRYGIIVIQYYCNILNIIMK